ncbi:M48 family metallopeptidase [Patescibacteria group bacterium]|nr:M48 family metallopeptidase [Patescibacteria group bacterium]
MQKIRILDQEFEVRVNKKKVKSLRLRIKEKNILEITTPWLTPKLFIEKFIFDNSSWIVHHNQKIKNKKNIRDLKSLEVLNEKYEVEIKKGLGDSLVIIDNKIFVNYKDEENVGDIFDKKMRNLAGKLIKEKTLELAKKYNLKYERVGIKNQSSRFGSCSFGGNLNFNWQIILFPKDKFEHVILHELTHLTVKNHSKDFWRQLAEYDKNWRENNIWLKKEGTKRFIV